MSKKPKKSKGRKGSQPAKKQTVAQQKRAGRALAKKLERQGADKQFARQLVNAGEDKSVATTAAKLARMGYKGKTALTAARNAQGSAKRINEERKEAIKAKFDKSNVILDVIEKYWPNAKYHSDMLAELIAQGKYEEIAEEFHNDLRRYAEMLRDKVETAEETNAPNFKEIEGDYDAFVNAIYKRR